ncbi:hypothetical protein [Agromyces bauzanensis]
MERVAKGIAVVVQVAVIVIVVIWDIWAIVVAFAGGWLPVPWPWYTEGGIGFGLLWLFILAPAITAGAVTLVSWILGLIAAPFIAVANRR